MDVVGEIVQTWIAAIYGTKLGTMEGIGHDRDNLEHCSKAYVANRQFKKYNSPR